MQRARYADIPRGDIIGASGAARIDTSVLNNGQWEVMGPQHARSVHLDDYKAKTLVKAIAALPLMPDAGYVTSPVASIAERFEMRLMSSSFARVVEPSLRFGVA